MERGRRIIHYCFLMLVLAASTVMPFSPSFDLQSPLTTQITQTYTSSSVSRTTRKSSLLLESHHTNLIVGSNTSIIHETLDEDRIVETATTSSQLLPQNHRLTTSSISKNKEEATETHHQSSATTQLPRHIAFICDGNSRWSKRQSLPKSVGHTAGADRVINVIKTLQRYASGASSELDIASTQQHPQQQQHRYQSKVEYCTFYAFSTENWSRSQIEINTIFKLMEQVAIQYRSHDAVQTGKVRIDLLGDMDDDRIPSGAKKELQRLQTESRIASSKRRDELGDDCANVLTVCLAINYGARADILQAAQKLAQSIASGELSPEMAMDESEISKRLCTAHVPDPDLIIRTSGETRLSNFLLWDAAYAELFFTDLLWPDFDEEALEEALAWYGKRKRRFGGRNE